MMDLTDLRVFLAVVEQGGITRAAEKLHRVQSNVTTRIKNLEVDLGIELFRREGKKLHLSAAGRTLKTYAEQLLSLAERAREALHESEPRGVLRLGSMESTAAARLPGILPALHERYPDLEVELTTGAPRELTALVLSGELDAALVAEPVREPRLGSIVAYEEKMVLVSDRRHLPIASPLDVSNRTMLALHPGCPHRAKLETWFASDGVPIERIVEVGSIHAIMGCVLAGMGVSLLPASILETFTQSGSLQMHEMDGMFGLTKTFLIWRGDAPMAKINAFAGLLPNALIAIDQADCALS